MLNHCNSDDTCSGAVRRFWLILQTARHLDGYAKISFVNAGVNSALQYRSDWEQWGVADLWSVPLDATGIGSFQIGSGDCEDFTIAKYAALQETGVEANCEFCWHDGSLIDRTMPFWQFALAVNGIFLATVRPSYSETQSMLRSSRCSPWGARCQLARNPDECRVQPPHRVPTYMRQMAVSAHCP